MSAARSGILGERGGQVDIMLWHGAVTPDLPAQLEAPAGGNKNVAGCHNGDEG